MKNDMTRLMASMVALLASSATLIGCGGGSIDEEGTSSGETANRMHASGSPPSGSALAPCTTTPAQRVGGSTKLAVAASRASGVAPLSVFFDTTTTSSSTTTRPFHDIEYRWNFGDATGLARGTWNQGSRAGSSARNLATGPLAAHVYEALGTYTVSVNDAANTV